LSTARTRTRYCPSDAWFATGNEYDHDTAPDAVRQSSLVPENELPFQNCPSASRSIESSTRASPEPTSLAVPPKSAHVAARYSPPALGKETVDAGDVESSTYV
jgi:hypothetical protein